MDKKLSEKLFLSLWMVDFDYISTRHLLAGSLFPSAASLANITMDRYIKTYLWSIERNDLVERIKGWGGNESHNVFRMVNLYEEEFNDSLNLSEQEKNTLKDIYMCYCFRYIDVMYIKKGMCKIFKNYMYTIDKVCHFFREKIKLIPPHQGNTIIDILFENNSQKVASLNTGNINPREVLLADNLYFRIQDKSH